MRCYRHPGRGRLPLYQPNPSLMNHSLFQKLIFVTLFAGVVVALTGNSPSRESSAEPSSQTHYSADFVR